MQDEPVGIYRCDPMPLIRFFAGTLGLLWILILAGFALLKLRIGKPPTFEEIAALVLTPIVALLAFSTLVYLLVLVFPVRVYRHGVACFDWIGFSRVIPWTDIDSISEIWIYNLLYLIVRGRSLEQPYHLPLWLRDFDAFRSQVEGLAGQESPLVRALNKRTE